MAEPDRNQPTASWLPRHVRRLLEWIARHELSVLIALMALVGSVWGFIELADVVMEGKTMRFDEWAVRAMRQPGDVRRPIGPTWFVEVARDVTSLGGVAFLMLLIAVITGFLWIRRMYGAVTLLLVATCGGAVLSLALKSAYDRPRPASVTHLVATHTSSFPSGHAMLSATVFLTIGALLGRFVSERVLKAYFLIVAIILTFLVGASRVYMGVHYPTDVLTGWVAGLAWALTCWLVARFMQRRNLVPGDISTADRDG